MANNTLIKHPLARACSSCIFTHIRSISNTPLLRHNQ